ncbi:hypothetical protein OHB00_15825 [Streptomyces sp. NBC_00631]|uniref:hypothetical protein n=1 Tax=Streptomyces sp. NBC_00631 TaxID=2975793 RepID=UPI0030E1DDEE
MTRQPTTAEGVTHRDPYDALTPTPHQPQRDTGVIAPDTSVATGRPPDTVAPTPHQPQAGKPA